MSPSIQQSLQDVYDFINGKVNDLCRPNPKYMKHPSQIDADQHRNKCIFGIYVCIVGLFLFNMIFQGGPVADNLVAVSFAFMCVSYLFFSRYFHPQVFKSYYNIICLVYGPSAILSGPEGIYIAFFFVLIIPLFVQLITGSFWHFLFQVFLNNIFLNTFYQKQLRQVLEDSTPEEILNALTHACNMSMVLQVVSLGLMGRFIQEAHQKAMDFEQKKNEAENQKVFLLGFSHELRNLINSLTGNVKLASLENLGQRAKEFLNNAEICGELLLHMINNILDTGKSAIGELEINMTPTQTYDGFERIWAICSELIRRKDLAGHMKLPKNLPQTLMMDHHRLTQIFLNLVGNAIKFTDKGAINITVEWLSHKQAVREECFQPYPFNTRDEQDEGLFEKQQGFSTLGDDFFILNTKSQKVNKSQIQPSIYSRRGILKMIVRDTGCGMDTEQLNRLFQKFTQVTADEAKKKLGTGLGLFITKQLCQKMDGEVRAFSERGKGSTFIFCLPAKTTDDRDHFHDDLETLKLKIAEQNLRALIVDDALSNHVIIGNFFDVLGIQVANIAVNGLEAYQKYAQHLNQGNKLQLVAMDLDMPIMNGKEASQKIRELEQQRGIRPCFLVIISGNCVESEVNECLDKTGKIRADAFIRKPIKMEELIRVISVHFLKDEPKRIQ